MSEQEFYVGYLPKAPVGIAKRVRVAVCGLMLVAGVTAIGFAVVQRTFAPSVFEYGVERSFEGVLEMKPFPTLLVRRPGETTGHAQYSRYLLVAAGKHGADQQVAPFAGKSVRLRGTLIYRDDQAMVELAPGSISETAGSNSRNEQRSDLGTMELSGEIVDSKCNFGVMNPGAGKVHRDCAVRCLSGGIPPAFVTTNFHGTPATLLLTGPDEKPLDKGTFPNLAGQPVRARGTVVRVGDTLQFEVDPDSIAVLP